MTGQNELKKALGAKNSSGSSSLGATVCVYGYGQSKTPFYKEAKALRRTRTAVIAPQRYREPWTEAAAHERAAKCNRSGDRQYTLGEWAVVRSGGLVSGTAPRFLAAASVRTRLPLLP